MEISFFSCSLTYMQYYLLKTLQVDECNKQKHNYSLNTKSK